MKKLSVQNLRLLRKRPGAEKETPAADKERIFRSYAALKSVFHRRGRELGAARRKIAELEERLAALEREKRTIVRRARLRVGS